MTAQQLLIFTRYPEAGKTKTRLIPALGALGAAQLQRYLTEYTLTVAQASAELNDLKIKIYYTGGSLELMTDWLGEQAYYLQDGQDLGQRLTLALAQAIADGGEKVLIIGIDCLDLTPDLLHSAFTALSNHDLVLGPALDGGYYLIGLKRFIPELFTNVPWSTDKVLTNTQKIAEELQLSSFLLPPLQDLDLPEDLPLQLVIKFSK